MTARQARRTIGPRKTRKAMRHKKNGPHPGRLTLKKLREMNQ